MPTYNSANWYWLGQPVGQSSPIIYSSAAATVVPATNAAYEAWLALGYGPTPWPKDATGAVTVEALDEVQEAAGLPPTGLAHPTKAQLRKYVNKLAAGALASGAATMGTINTLTANIDAEIASGAVTTAAQVAAAGWPA